MAVGQPGRVTGVSQVDSAQGSTLLLARRIYEHLGAIEHTLAAAGHPVAGPGDGPVSQIGELRADIAAPSKKIDDLATDKKKNDKKKNDRKKKKRSK